MNKKSHEPAQGILDKEPSCYVLVACGEPSKDGKIEVEMTYHGEATLASYLLQEAQGFIEESAMANLSDQSLELIKS